MRAPGLHASDCAGAWAVETAPVRVVAVAAAKWRSLGVKAAHVIHTSKEVKSLKETIGRVAEGRALVTQMTL